MRKQIIKICCICGKQFIAKTRYIKCCCRQCANKCAAITRSKNNTDKRIHSVNDFFLRKDCNEKYYFLGLMASDGYVTFNQKNNCKTIGISQSGESGLKIIQYLKQLLNYTGPILSHKPKNGKTSYSLCFRSVTLFDDLNFNNIVPNKTKNFCVPDYILQDENKLKYFLIGYIDGDGCIGIYKNMLSISFVCSFFMYKQLKNLKLFKSARFAKGCGGNVMDIRFNGEKAIEFAQWLYKHINVFKSHKYNKYMDYYVHRFEISKHLLILQQVRDINALLDKNSNVSSQQISEMFNISLVRAQNIKYRWRLKHGLSRKFKKRTSKR